MALVLVGAGFFFFNQKTAYEMRISDWSSDVCSSDLAGVEQLGGDFGSPQRDLVEAGTKPIEAAVDRCGVGARQVAHRARIALGARDRLGDSTAGRAAANGGVGYIEDLAVAVGVDHSTCADGGRVGSVGVGRGACGGRR